MFQVGDRVAFRESRLGEGYLVLGRVVGAAAETARLQVVWDLGGPCEELAPDDVVLVPEAAPRVTSRAARDRAVERAWGSSDSTPRTWDQIDALVADDRDPEPAPVPDWQQFYGSSRRV